MTFHSRITRLPRPFEEDRAAEALGSCDWATGPVAELIAGAGGSSPYLHGLMEREGAWLEGALADPEAGLAALLSEMDALAFDAVDSGLRQAKRRVALLSGLCDLAGVWSLEDVTGALTDFADTAVTVALRGAIAQEVKRGKLPGGSMETLDEAGGMVALAMGKMGAHELNYSSDIDLICLFDETRYDPSDYHEARASLVRATRKMAQTLNEPTGEGYVLRTDLRLRPDPSVTPVCMAMEAAERYYESLGRTWERAAYIKARPAAGDLGAGARFLQTLTPFVWRRHLDFAAIEDAHAMRLRYREHKGTGGAITLPGHNMKLGRGGIREIEFFTQTRQLIAGGRDPELRQRGTVPGLAALASKGWIPGEVGESLTEHYRFHREVEHRVQMVRDAQTHDLPQTPEGFARLACLMGRDLAGLERELKERLGAVHALTEDFFAPDAAGQQDENPLVRSDIVARWPTYPALRSERAVTIFRRLRPEILRKLAQAAKPDEALVAFDGFLAGLPAGVQLFSLFEANPQLVDLLIDVVSTSPDLARYLSRNAAVFDAVIGGSFFAKWPGVAALTAELVEALAREGDYERQLDLARRWGKEEHFRIGVHLLRGLMEPEEAGQAYAQLAEATLAALFPVVQQEFARKHGAAPGRGAVVLGMGSLGSARQHARSDLDVIVIYDADGVENSDGKRPLPSRTYYARLTQALVTAMTAPMAEGRLYELDMRLRPSGNQGPVATSLTAFRDYQANEAWTWEHLALTRARVVAGDAALAADVEGFRAELLGQPREAGPVLQEVATMRARINAAKGQGGPWEAKLGAGRMQEIELIAQAASLIAGKPVRQVPRALLLADWLGAEGQQALRRAYALAWSIQIGSRLVSDKALDPADLGTDGCAFLARLTGFADMESLQAAFAEATEAAARHIDAALPQLEDET